jgi:GMP synthase (glutamine-hydrolysing)
MISKPFVILQIRPEDDTSNSEFAAILKYGGLNEKNVRRIRIEKTGIPRLFLEDYSAVIVGGSPFDISTPEQDKSLNQKKIEGDFRRLLNNIVANDFPFLGACSGCGLLGSYLNTSISGKYAEPVGGVSVCVTDEGKKDSLLEGFPDQITVLLGHKEACDDTPAGASLLIRGQVCPVQMFRIGNNVYATQFHPEGDCEGFTLRIRAYKNHGYFAPEEAQCLIQAVGDHETPFAQEILKRFVNRYSILLD